MSESSGRPAPFGIPADVWDLLACPCPEHAALVPDVDAGVVTCTSCGRRFPVRDGIPVLLLDEALPGAGA